MKLRNKISLVTGAGNFPDCPSAASGFAPVEPDAREVQHQCSQERQSDCTADRGERGE